ncbi:MAG: hypothetical protein E7643_03455 [Ruminococcaceae bacterium]|nr:hypothetical protein [Oscillospiraceae bacterium]
MKKIRTRQFLRALYTSLGFSALFLLWMLLFGKDLAVNYFHSVTGCVFAVLGMAVLTFVCFCFFPYFRGDRRWFVIPSLLTLVFFVGTALLWQVPIVGGTV